MTFLGFCLGAIAGLVFVGFKSLRSGNAKKRLSKLNNK